MQKTVVIPAYQPDARLAELVKELAGNFPVLIVDDGSDAACAPIFGAAQELGARVLRHEANRGKGAALRTAFAYLKENGAPDAITADADGQHTYGDILAVAREMDEHPGAFILGGRDFSKMPPKSRFGNTVTRFVFRLCTGLAVSDTQTGLRGIPGGLLGNLLGVRGDRYEYELNVLLELGRWGVPCREIPIATIYLDGNRSSHFHPVRDGLKVFSQLLRYMLSSLGCTLLDYGLYCLLLSLLAPGWSYALARVVSASAHYQLVRRVVFRADSSPRSALYYGLLAALSMAMGAAGTALLTQLGVHSVAAKLMLDALLFLMNYLVQRRLIFRPSAGLGE